MGHANMEPRLAALFRASRRADGTIAKGWSPLTDEERRQRRIESHRRWNAKNKEHVDAYNKSKRAEKRLSKPVSPTYQAAKRDERGRFIKDWSPLTREEYTRRQLIALAKWRANNKDKMREQHRAWRKKRRAYIKEKQRVYNAQERVKAKNRQRQLTEQAKEKRREYLNRPTVREKNNALGRARMRRYLLDPHARLIACLRSSINRALKRQCETRSWREFIDYDIATLRAHLERQFKNGMTWENRGKAWHIDHIVPVSELRGDIRACWALANLRPLWAKENLAKTNKRIFLV